MEVSGSAIVGISGLLSANMLMALLVFSLALLLFCYLMNSGVFRTVQVDTKAAPYGEMTIAYKTGKGAYKNTALVHSESLRDLQLPDSIHHPHIGIYYDDPEAVPEAELRYAVGVVLATDDQDPDPVELEKLLEKGYKLAVLPKQQFAVVSSFPLHTNLSVYVAIYKVRVCYFEVFFFLCHFPRNRVIYSHMRCS